MSVSDSLGNPKNAGKEGGRRVTRLVATALAVTAACSGLAWAAVVLTSDDSVDAKSSATCTYTPTKAGGKSAVLPAFNAQSAAQPYSARLVTNMGTVIFQALTTKAPCATNSFAFLARNRYYNGSKCYRLTTKNVFTLDCGDPKGDGKADPGYYFADENLDGAVYPAGTVAMAKAAPGRNGSQFFISYADPESSMPAGWTPFGKVVRGLDVLKRIAANGTADGSTDGKPRKPVVITSVTVSQAMDMAPGESGR